MRQPLLSICMPTYDRCDMVVNLVQELLKCEGDFEICVHVDGSLDGTYEALQKIVDARLRITWSPNRGRGEAMLAAMRASRGNYLMIMDDDDELFGNGLTQVLVDCGAPPPRGCIGYVYHLSDEAGRQIGQDFPVERTNFLSLRADHRVRGDKKEVVLANVANAVAFDGHGKYRRIPTSLIWSRLSLSYDVICRNVVIGKKVYLKEGMTSNIKKLKSSNAYPMYLVHRTHCQAFLRRRYFNIRHFGRSVVAMAVYGMLALKSSLRKESA